MDDWLPWVSVTEILNFLLTDQVGALWEDYRNASLGGPCKGHLGQVPLRGSPGRKKSFCRADCVDDI